LPLALRSGAASGAMEAGVVGTVVRLVCGRPAQAVLGDDRNRLLGHDRRAHLRHWAGVDLFFLLQRGVQDAQHLVAGGRGGRRPTLEEVAEERLQVGPAGVQQGPAAAGQERLGLADALQVALDRAAGAVLGPQVPLEGAEQAGCIVGCHGRTVAQPAEGQGMGPVSVMRPVQSARNAELTSVPVGQSGYGAPRRNRTGDPILTMYPRPTAMRPSVSQVAADRRW
jgi:hypothetical protein